MSNQSLFRIINGIFEGFLSCLLKLVCMLAYYSSFPALMDIEISF